MSKLKGDRKGDPSGDRVPTATSTPTKPKVPSISATDPNGTESSVVPPQPSQQQRPQPQTASEHPAPPGKGDDLDLDDEEGPLPITLIPILFKEATLDTPSFRAHCEHKHKQFEEVEQWLEALLVRNGEIDRQLKPLRMAVNGVLEMFMPSFLYNNVVDQSSISLLFKRYAEGVSSHWTSVMFEARKHFAHIVGHVRKFNAGTRNNYRTSRARWLQQQKLYDRASSEYYTLSRKSDSSTFRDAAQQVYKYRVRYLKQSLLFCESLVDTTTKLNSLLCDIFTPLFEIETPTFIPLPKRMEIAHDMHRLSSYSENLKQTKSFWMQGCEKVREEMLEGAKRSAPSKVHTDYLPARDALFEASARLDIVKEKYGWVSVKVPSGTGRHSHGKSQWVRVWAFLKSGEFGWLGISPSGTFVQESPRVSVPLCTLSNAPREERSFCFRVTTPRFSFVVQTESNADLRGWVSAFSTARHDFMHSPQAQFDYFPTWTNDIACHSTAPLFEKAETRTTASERLQASISNEIDKCIDQLSGSLAVLDTGSAPSKLLNMVPPLLHYKPVGTSRSIEALVASKFLGHINVPNAVVGNYGGSVNWALQSNFLLENLADKNIKPGAVDLGGNVYKYPEFYPELLQYHDMDMRSYFGANTPHSSNEDLVVMSVRCCIRMRADIFLPCILYCTGKSVITIDYSAGFGGFLMLPLVDLLNVQSNIGADFDTVRLTYRSGNTFEDMDLKFYIDSGALFKRRLQFLFDNCKNEKPLLLEPILRAIELIGREHADEVQNTVAHETVQTNQSLDLVTKTGVASGEVPEEEAGEVYVEEAKLHDLSNTRQIQHHSAEMKLRAEGVFRVWPKQMFYLLFGDRSKIVSRYAADPEDLQWYYNDGQIQRVVHIDLTKILWSFNLSHNVQTFDFTQTIERRDENYFYSIIETSSVFSFYSAKFRVSNKYIIALTKSGTKLMIYNSVDWIQHSTMAKSVVDKMVDELCSRRPTYLLEQVRSEIRRLPRKKHDPSTFDVSEYGKIRITGTMDERKYAQRPDSVENKVISHRAVVGFNRFVVRFIVVGLFKGLYDMIQPFLKWIVETSSANFWLLVLAFSSLACNVLLASATSMSIWKSYWLEKNIVDYTNSLHMFPGPNTVLKRAVFSQDIESLVHRERGFNEIADEDNLCWTKFKKLALTNADEFANEFSLVPGTDAATQATIEQLFERRLEIAIKRNELLSQLHKLEKAELELIRVEWKKWVLQEVGNCNRARAYILAANETELAGELIDYCVPCLDAAKVLL